VDLLFERALLPDGIADRVLMSISAEGRISRITPNARDGGRYVPGLALPGMPNLHSHAFQRGIAGATELSSAADNSFWGWRETMYRFVGRLQPPDVEAIAAFAYLEMLEAGYTSVAEFHYLHHRADGSHYDDPLAMSQAVRAGAYRSGIRQLLLPCLYQSSGFGAGPVLQAQRRFINQTREFLQLFEQLRRSAAGLQTTGVALHSLRAVPASALRDIHDAVPAQTPLHIHVSEQQREVDDCLNFTGQRPIEYLLATVPVSANWCLVHATHANASELAAIRKTGAIVGLCPTTEANLGDGQFPLDEFVAAGGRFGIGSDSQVSIDPREELRTAEYSLRLSKQRRGLIGGANTRCGTQLYAFACCGGSQAMGLGEGALVVGSHADLVIIDTDQPQFAGQPVQALLDTHIFAPRARAVRDVMVGGNWVLRDAQHPMRDAIAQAYRDCVQRLMQ
jgi:formimidoylglutamate deiminase